MNETARRSALNVIAVALTALLLVACRSTNGIEETGAGAVTAWSPSFTPPGTLTTARVHLEPLAPRHAQLDYEAFMSSREHLHRTLHWGSWPRADATVAENRKDLQRHEREFLAREAYAYTVLESDRSAAIGCVYMNPVKEQPRAMELSYWVVEPAVASGLDEHLLAAVIDWVRRDWPIDTIVMDVHTENERGIAIARHLGLQRAEAAASGEHVRFQWRRSGGAPAARGPDP